MQFLAFLKDSFREAKSGWMLQIMLALAFILVMLVASVGFHPITVQDQLSEPLRFMTRMIGLNPAEYDRVGHPEFSIDDVKASNKAEPWKSDYTFDFIVACPSIEDVHKAQKGGQQDGLPTTRPQINQFLRQTMPDYETVEVEDAYSDASFYAVAGAALAADPPVPGKQLRFPVHVSGSKIDDPLAWPHRVSVLFVWDIPLIKPSLRDGLYFMENWVVNQIGGWVLLFVGVVVTAGFIPSMLAKGSLDLLLSKPIGRSRLFVYKYIGGLTWVFVLTSLTVFGFWLAIGIRSGFWTLNFLATIPVLTFYFAILYAVSAATAMFTRNALASILVTIIAWGMLWGIGRINDSIESRREAAAERAQKLAALIPSDNNARDGLLAQMEAETPLWGVIPTSTFPVFTTLHTLSPRTYQLDDRLSRIIAEGVLSPYQLKKRGFDKSPRESWGEMIGVSLAFIAACLGLSCWRFETRDH
jgi:ABC-type transport system involved in multi-copper enzyme maturation permease subunit